MRSKIVRILYGSFPFFAHARVTSERVFGGAHVRSVFQAALKAALFGEVRFSHLQSFVPHLPPQLLELFWVFCEFFTFFAFFTFFVFSVFFIDSPF